MNKLDYLMKFRKLQQIHNLELVFSHMKCSVPQHEEMAFNSAYDHRKAELTLGKLWDKVPATAWQYVK